MFIELHLYIDRRGADRRVVTVFGSCPAYQIGNRPDTS